MSRSPSASASLARSITWRSSRHTYYTIQWLADRDRVSDAFRAYAYFRWVDDQIDAVRPTHRQRLDFVARQSDLMDAVYRGAEPDHTTPAEQLLIELIRQDPRRDSGLACYLRNMMDVMTFDAGRRGRLITQSELDRYTHSLALAVSEALHYFIGHGRPAPQSPTRYLAVSAAHIIHMLRDTLEDVAAGYFNIPLEALAAGSIGPGDVASPGYRAWVQQRVARARRGFDLGKAYLAQVSSRRCRLAGFAYSARFEAVLDAIERNRYDLTALPPSRSARVSGLNGWRALAAALPSPLPQQLVSPRAAPETTYRSTPPIQRVDRSP